MRRTLQTHLLAAATAWLALSLGMADARAQQAFQSDLAVTAQLSRKIAQDSNVRQAAFVLAARATSDSDGYALAPAPTAGTTVTGGGLVPTSSGAPRTDGFGRNLGYCAWDNGTSTGAAGYIAGSNSLAALALAVVSPGGDNVFSTTCAQIAAGQPASGDDFYVAYTSGQVLAGVQGTTYFSDPVNTVADLSSIAPSALQNGQVRLVRATNQLYRYNSAATSWQVLTGGQWVDAAVAGDIYYDVGNVAIGSTAAQRRLTVRSTAVPVGIASTSNRNGVDALDATTAAVNAFFGFDTAANQVRIEAQRAGSSLVLSTGGGSVSVNSAGLLNAPQGMSSGAITATTLTTSGAITTSAIQSSGPMSITSTALTLAAPTTVTGLLSANSGISATTGTYSGALTANGGLIATTGTFSGALAANGGLTATTGTFSGAVAVSGALTATGGVQGPTGMYGTDLTNRTINGRGAALQIKGGTTSTVDLGMVRWNTDTGAAGIALAKGNSNTPGTMTALTSGQQLGIITFGGADGTALSASAQIVAQSTQAWSGTARGSSLALYVTPNNSTTVTQAVLIDQDRSVDFFGNVNATAGLTATTGTFSGALAANGGLSGTTGTFSGGLTANGGLTATTGSFSSTLTASGLITANGGISATTGTFSGALAANGGLTATTGAFTGALAANGGLAATTGSFSGALTASGLLSATGGLQGPSAAFGTDFTNRTINGRTPAVEIKGSTSASVDFGLVRWHTDAFAPAIVLARGNSLTAGTMTALASGQQLGLVSFGGADGTALSASSQILATATQAWSGTARGSSLGLYVTPNNSATMSQAVLIDQDRSVDFFGAVTATAGLTSTTGTFSGALAANGGLTATTGTFSGTLAANGGMTATTGSYSSTLGVSGLLTASGGISATTGTYSGALAANGGLTATTGTFSGTLAANGGLTTPTGLFGSDLTSRAFSGTFGAIQAKGTSLNTSAIQSTIWTTGASGAHLHLAHGHSGTPGTMTATPANTQLGAIVFGASNGSTIDNGAYIQAASTQNWTTTAMGTKMDFNVTPNGSTTKMTALTLDQDGKAYLNTPGAWLTVGAVGVGGFNQIYAPGQYGTHEGAFLGTAGTNGGAILDLNTHTTATQSASWRITHESDTYGVGALHFLYAGAQTDRSALAYTRMINIDNNGSVAVPYGNASLGFRAAVLPTDTFTTDTNKVIHNYSVSWKVFSDQPNAPTLALAGWGGQRFYTNGAERMRIGSDGYVGINRVAAGYLLDVNGGVRATSYTTASDARLKHDISTIGGNALLERFMSVRPVIYTMNDSKARNYGYIAQELRPLFPEMVMQDTEGFLGVQYTQMIPVLTAVAQQQQRQIQELERRKMDNLVDRWIESSDQKARLLFERDGKTVLRGHGPTAVELRDDADRTVARFRRGGDVDLFGMVNLESPRGGITFNPSGTIVSSTTPGEIIVNSSRTMRAAVRLQHGRDGQAADQVFGLLFGDANGIGLTDGAGKTLLSASTAANGASSVKVLATLTIGDDRTSRIDLAGGTGLTATADGAIQVDASNGVRIYNPKTKETVINLGSDGTIQARRFEPTEVVQSYANCDGNVGAIARDANGTPMVCAK